MKRWLVAFAVVVALVIPVGAHAEEITTFDSNVTVQQSGRVDVTESIDYDFGYTSRHGIYRYIPVVYQNDKDEVYKPVFSLDNVTVDGQPAQYSLSRDGDNQVIKIGDPNRTIDGAHRYVITYHFNELLVDSGGDLLRFNVTGGGWSVPINAVRLHITGPSQPKIVCYAGNMGDKETNRGCTVDEAAGTVMAQAGGNGRDLTVEALWPAGSVTNLLAPYKTPLWQKILLIAALLYLLAGIVMMVAALVRWLGIRYAERRAERNQTIVAQYEPPKSLTAGEIGFLADNSLSMVEVTATLIAAAVAGYIRIEQTQAKMILKKAQYKLTKLKDFSGMDAGEQDLLKTIFNGKSEIALSDVDRTAVPAAIGRYQKSVREKAKQLGLYTARSKFITTGGAAVVTVVVVLSIVSTPAIALVGLAALPIGLWLYRRAGQVPRRTPEGLETWAYVQGFKLFLSVTEKDRLAFTDAPERTPKQFSKMLPYAIALGVEQQWAKQFEGIDIAQSTGWYIGHDSRVFTAGYLVGNLHDSFASSVAVASKSPSQSSSGGFGGGFSGGGFGGGGGGSW